MKWYIFLQDVRKKVQGILLRKKIAVTKLYAFYDSIFVNQIMYVYKDKKDFVSNH